MVIKCSVTITDMEILETNPMDPKRRIRSRIEGTRPGGVL